MEQKPKNGRSETMLFFHKTTSSSRHGNAAADEDGVSFDKVSCRSLGSLLDGVHDLLCLARNGATGAVLALLEQGRWLQIRFGDFNRD